jgi:hypothetical protein
VDALKGVLQREPAFNPDTNVYAGNTIIAPVIVLQAAQPAGSHPATVLSAEMLQKAVDTYTGWRRMTYERVGDVMLTPWSVDLGPVGLMPAKANANQALGHWESAGRGLDVLAVAERPQARANPPADVQLGRPRAKEIDAMESRLEFDADDGGIHTKTYGWFCGANHGDHEGYIYWFLTPDDRLVRILYPAYCDGGGGPRPQNPRVDVYVKK